MLLKIPSFMNRAISGMRRYLPVMRLGRAHSRVAQAALVGLPFIAGCTALNEGKNTPTVGVCFTEEEAKIDLSSGNITGITRKVIEAVCGDFDPSQIEDARELVRTNLPRIAYDWCKRDFNNYICNNSNLLQDLGRDLSRNCDGVEVILPRTEDTINKLCPPELKPEPTAAPTATAAPTTTTTTTPTHTSVPTTTYRPPVPTSTATETKTETKSGPIVVPWKK